MMPSWVPQPAGLQEVVETLHNSTRSQDIEVQRTITLVIQLPD